MEMTVLKNKKGSEKNKDKAKDSFIGKLAEDYLFKPSLFTTISYLNIIVLYIVFLALITGNSLSYWYLAIYIPFIYIITQWRESRKERIRLEIAHRMPYFAEALANALNVGSTLEQSFYQASYYLKGKIKEQFDILILKNRLGKDLGEALWELDEKFPRTGLRYIIALLEKYKELGVGVSPLLKKISETLNIRSEAEEKIKIILSGGSGYARMAIGLFGLIFLVMSFMLKGQMVLLFSPSLKPYFLFLLTWTCVGIILITRLTSMEFARNFSLKPYIREFMKSKDWNTENLMTYSSIHWTEPKKFMLSYSPLFFGFFFAYMFSWYTGDFMMIMVGFILGSAFSWFLIKQIIKGLIEDQLINVIETFPELLQIFIIGLNSGLNTYLAFQFAQESIKGNAPKILNEELCRAKFAMECGETHARTWQRLAEKLPFETVIDFSEIMVIVPLQGESIVKSITQMSANYQAKKLTLMEKKANALGQMVIPLIVFSFFPLFLFVIFAPILKSMSNMIN
jgi:Flp pilus assembly protein TadB